MDNSQSSQPSSSSNQPGQPAWRPLASIERRVLGVMVEKSKTTPTVYPMTVNAITTASNQKNNRKPQMQLNTDDVEAALSDLRESGVVTEIQGDGRALKFKHHLYEWLGVDRVELAVMAELFLRGEQTIGDLRGRTSRMEKIADLAALKPVLASLLQKDLVIALTPPGRGQMVTHNLYEPEQLVKIQQQFGSGGTVCGGDQPFDSADDETDGMPAGQVVAADSVQPTLADHQAHLMELEGQLTVLKERVARLENLLD